MKFSAMLMITVTMIFFCTDISAQKKITDGTITYDIVITTAGKEPQMTPAMASASTTIYLKNNFSRTDMVNSMGSESTIYDSKTGNAFILKDYSGQKLMITLTKENWEEKNAASSALVFDTTTETKTINGILCKKATAVFSNGKTLTVYFASSLIPANKDYNPMFRNLPGLAMEYEVEYGKSKYKYTVAKINYDVLQASSFEAPKTGYRVMTYEENKAIKKSGL